MIKEANRLNTNVRVPIANIVFRNSSETTKPQILQVGARNIKGSRKKRAYVHTIIDPTQKLGLKKSGACFDPQPQLTLSPLNLRHDHDENGHPKLT